MREEWTRADQTMLPPHTLQPLLSLSLSRSDKMLHNTDDATFRMMLEVHTVAPFRLVRAAAPYLRIKEADKRENRSIVMVSTPRGHPAGPLLTR